jgi:hypothetical protein
MHSAHMADMKSWKYPLVSYLVYAIRESGRGPAGLPSDKFTGNEEQDWKTIADYINFLIDFWVGIKIHDSSNPLSDLAVKINQAVTNRQLTITKQTVTPISGPVGYTTADAVVAGYHPELVQRSK